MQYCFAVPEYGIAWPLLFCPFAGLIVAAIGVLFSWLEACIMILSQ
jgi:hypothetical protein